MTTIKIDNSSSIINTLSSSFSNFYKALFDLYKQYEIYNKLYSQEQTLEEGEVLTLKELKEQGFKTLKSEEAESLDAFVRFILIIIQAIEGKYNIIFNDNEIFLSKDLGLSV